VGQGKAHSTPARRISDDPSSEVVAKLAPQGDDDVLSEVRRAGDDPKALSRVIAKAISDGHADRVNAASKHLLEVAQNTEKATVLRAVVLMRLRDRQTDEAIKLLSAFAREHGESPNILVTLGKAYELGGDTEGRDRLARQAAHLDPNNEHALAWFASLTLKRGGKELESQELERLAKRSGAWRPQLLLARKMLESGEIDRALEESSCALAKVDEDPKVLSATLDTFWHSPHLGEAIAQLASVYVPERHGASFGARLAKGMATVGRGRDASLLLKALRGDEPSRGASVVPPLRGTGEGHDPQRPKAAPTPDTTPEIAPETTPEPTRSVSVSDPIWTRGLDEPAWVLPRPASDAPRVVFSVFSEDPKTRAAGETRNALALPLFLLETCRVVARLPTLMLIPWVPGRGPLISKPRRQRESLLSVTPEATERDISVVGSLGGASGGHRMEIDLFHTASGRLIGSEHIVAATSAELAMRSAESVLGILSAYHAPSSALASPVPFEPPPSRAVDTYLQTLDRLLTQSGAAGRLVEAPRAADVAVALAGYAKLAESWPDAIQPRLALLAGALLGVRTGTPITPHYADQLNTWMTEESPLGKTLARFRPLLLLRTGNAAGAKAAVSELRPDASGDYASWLADLAAAANYALRH